MGENDLSRMCSKHLDIHTVTLNSTSGGAYNINLEKIIDLNV